MEMSQLAVILILVWRASYSVRIFYGHLHERHFRRISCRSVALCGIYGSLVLLVGVFLGWAYDICAAIFGCLFNSDEANVVILFL